jgi:hypothetical protein
MISALIQRTTRDIELNSSESEVARLRDIGVGPIEALLEEYGLRLGLIADDQPIPSSFWGDPEAGLKGQSLFARADTPIHSILHETCHFICMSAERRLTLDTNAGGDYDEENAVCYLQILLADRIKGFGRDRCLADMDRWGYSFRLGSARAWFERDAEDARLWLDERGLLPEAD